MRLSSALMRRGYRGKFRGLALPERYIAQGSVEEQFEECGLLPEQALLLFQEKK